MGTTTLIGVDGFSGAGKSTLAAALSAADPAVTVLSIESFYLGWDGLAAGPGRAAGQLVAALARGETPVVTPWDWRRGREGGPRERPVGPLAVLEGCGAGARVLRSSYALLVWVHAGPDDREARLRARPDREDYAPHRAAFERQEQALAAAEGSRAAADVVVTSPGTDGWFVLPA